MGARESPLWYHTPGCYHGALFWVALAARGSRTESLWPSP